MSLYKDFTGMRFHRLVVLSIAGTKPMRWLCQCDCGNTKVINADHLGGDGTKSCGCLWLRRQIDITGKRFGFLTALRRDSNHKKKWVCRCDCGNETSVFQENLKAGRTVSCGCHNLTKSKTHGLTLHPLYGTWLTMVHRCTNPKHAQYHNYGGRGITVCDRWLASFPAFLEDMGQRPKGYTLERLDNDKGYCKENCVWAPWESQVVNKRTNRVFTAEGVTLIARDWAQLLGLSYSTFLQRLGRGWTLEEVIATPPKPHKTGGQRPFANTPKDQIARLASERIYQLTEGTTYGTQGSA